MSSLLFSSFFLSLFFFFWTLHLDNNQGGGGVFTPPLREVGSWNRPCVFYDAVMFARPWVPWPWDSQTPAVAKTFKIYARENLSGVYSINEYICACVVSWEWLKELGSDKCFLVVRLLCFPKKKNAAGGFLRVISSLLWGSSDVRRSSSVCDVLQVIWLHGSAGIDVRGKHLGE